MKKETGTRPGKRIIAGLKEIAQALESGEPLEGKLISHTYELSPPAQHDSHSVRAIRRRMGMSQQVFAQLVGVSKVLVQSWEQGQRKPSALACRLLDSIKANPTQWMALIRRKAG